MFAHSQPLDRGVAYRLADAAWTRGVASAPAFAGPWWINWKSLAASVVCAGVVGGGVAIGWRDDPAPVVVASAAPGEPPAAVPETLQERNVRIATNEIVPPLRELLQKLYPPTNEVREVYVGAVGSEVEFEFEVTPPPPAITGFAARLRGRYCIILRRLIVHGQPDGETRWYSMNPQRPFGLNIPIPFGAPLELVRGREEFAAAERLFAQLPADDRAEPELLRALFGPRGGELLLPTENRGVSGFPGGLILVASGGGMYVRDGSWRMVGECPGWWPVVADGQVYCDWDREIWSRPLAKPSAPWVKWCDKPTPGPEGEQATGLLFVADERLCMTMKPHGLCSVPLANPAVGWTRTKHPISHAGVAAVGDTLFGNDGKQLFKRPAAQLDAAWVPVGPWPPECNWLVADGERLLAYGWGPVPIYARSITAPPTEPWTKFGRLHDPYKR